MPETMIERVAQATYAISGPKTYNPNCYKSRQWGHATAADREHHRAMARAAIGAMQEPTDEMRRAAELSAGDMFTGLETAAYTAMIEAALEEAQDA